MRIYMIGEFSYRLYCPSGEQILEVEEICIKKSTAQKDLSFYAVDQYKIFLFLNY